MIKKPVHEAAGKDGVIEDANDHIVGSVWPSHSDKVIQALNGYGEAVNMVRQLSQWINSLGHIDSAALHHPTEYAKHCMGRLKDMGVLDD